MHILDIVAGIILFLGMIYGFRVGLISSLLTLVGLFVSLVLVVYLGPQVAGGIMESYGTGVFMSLALAYLLIIVMIAVLVTLLKILFNYIAHLLMLTLINKALGAAFAFCSVLVLFMLFMLLVSVLPFLSGMYESLNKSVIFSECGRFVEIIRYELPAEFFTVK